MSTLKTTNLQNASAASPALVLNADGTCSQLGVRNAIINGNPIINQRGYVSGTATSGANQYTLDRWRVVTSGQSITFTDSDNVRTVTTPAGGLEQVIEGINLITGTYTLNWTGTATATVAGNAVAKGGNVSITGATDTTLRFSSGTVSLVQFEPGTVATPFERRSYGQELALCQRYYQRTTAETASATLLTGVICSGASSGNGGFNLIGVMRTTPTLDSSAANTFVYSDGVNGTACTAVSLAGSQSNSKTAAINFSTAGGLTQFRLYRIEANSSATAFLGFSSEL